MSHCYLPKSFYFQNNIENYQCALLSIQILFSKQHRKLSMCHIADFIFKIINLAAAKDGIVDQQIWYIHLKGDIFWTIYVALCCSFSARRAAIFLGYFDIVIGFPIVIFRPKGADFFLGYSAINSNLLSRSFVWLVSGLKKM